ncbi:MAG TPA: LPS export ABC transporter periplasmic protein LptC [Bacteroidales bacterium]|nr:LPS export ABC transporter periplasmic protein LptC [Bacteroidales bacterium]
MKEQLLEHAKNTSKFYLKNIIIPACAGMIMFFSSCEQNSIEKINALINDINAPDISVTNTEIIYSEGAIIKVKIISPEINRYLLVEEPYTEFPKGLHVEFYDSLQRATSYIKANYCIFNENEKLWTAENNVVAVGEKGDTLNTEYLIWDQNKKIVYTDRYVRITNKDGIMHGKGFEAKQDLSTYKILNPRGTISVENEE